jgi:gas vesicle protein
MIRNKKIGKGVFKVLTGVIIGGAVGSILGLTLAPKKGKDTRKAIRDKSLEMFLKGKTELKKEHNIGPVKRVIIKALKPKKKPVTK